MFRTSKMCLYLRVIAVSAMMMQTSFAEEADSAYIPIEKGRVEIFTLVARAVQKDFRRELAGKSTLINTYEYPSGTLLETLTEFDGNLEGTSDKDACVDYRLITKDNVYEYSAKPSPEDSLSADDVIAIRPIGEPTPGYAPTESYDLNGQRFEAIKLKHQRRGKDVETIFVKGFGLVDVTITSDKAIVSVKVTKVTKGEFDLKLPGAAFGLALGDVYTGEIAGNLTADTAVTVKSPEASTTFTEYKAWLTPKTKRIYAIEGSGDVGEKKDQVVADTIADLKKKHPYMIYNNDEYLGKTKFSMQDHEITLTRKKKGGSIQLRYTDLELKELAQKESAP